MFSASQVHRIYHKLWKLRNLVWRQAQTDASKETPNIEPSSNVEQPKLTLVCSPCSSPKAVKVSITAVFNKYWRSDGDEGEEGPVTSATDKDCKRKRQNPEIQGNPDPFELMTNYFAKRFERIVAGQNVTLWQEKLTTLSNSDMKGTEYNLSSTSKFYNLFKICHQALNNDDASKAIDFCDDLTDKLKCRNKLVKMKNRSDVDWKTAAEYDETDPIAIVTQMAELRLDKPRTGYLPNEKYNKLTVYVSSQRPSGQQFRIDGEYNAFTPLNHRNFSCRFASNKFTMDCYFRRVQ